MKNNLLEKAIVCLLSEQHDDANKFMHQFMIARARQIHENLRRGNEDVLSENWNEDLTEDYFTEDDLEGLENTDALETDATDDLEDADADVEAAADDVTDADMDASDDLADDLGVDGDEDADVADSDLETLRDDLQALMAKFDDYLGDAGDDDLVDDGSDLPADEMVDGDEMGDEPVTDEADVDGLDDDDVKDITESIMDELIKVTADLDDGTELGGKKIEQNKKSALPPGKADHTDAKPIVIKSTNHGGNEREPAPPVKTVPKKSRNAFDSASKSTSSVPKGGSSAALLNKDFAGKTGK